jgi:hypothetical protein
MKKVITLLMLTMLIANLYPVFADDSEEPPGEDDQQPSDPWADSDGDGIPDQFDPFPDDAGNEGMSEALVQQFIDAANNIKELEDLLNGDDEEDDEEDDEGDDGVGDDEGDDGVGDDEGDDGVGDDEGDDGVGDDEEDQGEGEISQAVQTLYNVSVKLLQKAAERAAEGKNGAAKGLSNAALHTSGNALSKYEKDNGEDDEEDEEDEEQDQEQNQEQNKEKKSLGNQGTDNNKSSDNNENGKNGKGKGKGKGKDKNKGKGKGKGKKP